jgi:hypothetical protein
MEYLRHFWWESKLIQPLWISVWRFIKKPKIELPYDPVITKWACILRTVSQHIIDTCTHVFLAIHNSQAMESTYVPTNQRLDKENVGYTHNRVLFSHKGWNYVTCRKMDGNGDDIKWNKLKMTNIAMFSLVWNWDLKLYYYYYYYYYY